MEKHEDMIEDKKAGQRHSIMSLEPVSPSSSGHSIAESEEQYNHDYPEAELQPHLSHASSVATIGGIPVLGRSQSHRSGRSTATSTDPAFEVDFEAGDPDDPQNRSLLRKCLIIAAMSYTTTCVVLFSTSYTSGIPGMVADLGISESTGIVGMTTYLLGIACGSLVLSPLSEMYGRRPIYIIAVALFIFLVLPCALVNDIATILAFRFLAAFCAAALISNSPGTINDIVDEEHRVLAFSVFSIAPINSPVIGSIAGGFIYQYLGWRWNSWIVMIVSGIGFVFMLFIGETYGPVILRRRAARARKESSDDRYWSRYDEKTSFVELLKINLSRPFILMCTEPILIFFNFYVGIVYGILYLCFVAYPYVFAGIRGWSAGLAGLSFTGIGVGTVLCIVAEPLLRKIINSHRPDPESENGKPPPEAGVLVVGISAVLLPIGELIFAWTCTPNVHWIVPILAGIPFGFGNCGVFIYSSNYLVHSYNIYAASALASNAMIRSIAGATLPLAGTALYRSLGPNYAGTLLALLEAACIPIPFVFYRYGHKIRQRSHLIRQMREDRERMDAKRAKNEKTAVTRARAEAATGFAMETAAAMDEEVVDEKAIETMERHRPYSKVEAAVTQVAVRRSSMENVDLESDRRRRGSVGSAIVP